MRPPLHAIAPSLSALRYLRQVLFPRFYEYHSACMIANCLGPQPREGRFHRRLHAAALTERYGREQQRQQEEKVVPKPACPVERVKRKSRSHWVAKKQWAITKKKLLMERLEQRARKPSPPKLWAKRCRQLIRTKRLYEAMRKWLIAKSGNAKGEDVKDIGIKLMYAFNRNHQARETPQIFSGIVAYDLRLVDTRCLNLVLEAYLKNNRLQRVIGAFKRYRGILKPDHHTIEIVLRNFIALKRPDEAEKLLQILLEVRGSVTPRLFATLLEGVKQTTGDFREMRRIVEWMKTSGVKPHTSIYNIMIMAALDIGRPDVARNYAEEMVAKGLQYNSDTFVLFLSKQSKVGDWIGVRRTLERMYEHNLKIPSEGFNTLLNSLASAATDLSHTEKFFDSMVSHGIVPDQYSFNIMIHTCARFHKDAAKERWITRMKAAGFLPDAVTFNILFHELRKSHSLPTLLRRVYRTAASIDPNLISARTKRMLLDSMHKNEILPYLPRRPHQPMSDPFADETREMKLALNSGRPSDTICIFSDLISRGFKPSHPVIAAAIRAALRLPDSEHDEPTRLLYVAQERGVRVHEIVMSVIADDSESYPPDYINSATSTQRLAATLERLKSSYEFMERKVLTVSHYVLIQAAWSLISSGDADAAITLIHRITTSRWGATVQWDVVGLTVLLKAYTVMGDLRGIGWVIDQLEQNGIAPDKLFIAYLRRAKEVAQSKEDDAFIGWLLMRCLRHRTKLMDVETDDKARAMLKFFDDGKMRGLKYVMRAVGE